MPVTDTLDNTRRKARVNRPGDRHHSGKGYELRLPDAGLAWIRIDGPDACNIDPHFHAFRCSRRDIVAIVNAFCAKAAEKRAAKRSHL